MSDCIEILKVFSGLDESLRLIEVGVAAARQNLKEVREGWLDKMPIGPKAAKIDEIIWKVRNEAMFLPRESDRVRSVARSHDTEINKMDRGE